jgi:hypothetical protein
MKRNDHKYLAQRSKLKARGKLRFLTASTIAGKITRFRIKSTTSNNWNKNTGKWQAGF